MEETQKLKLGHLEDRVLPQMHRILEQHYGKVSRDKWPRLWKAVDFMGTPEPGAEAVRKRSTKRRTLLGVVSWLLGLALLTVGLKEMGKMILEMVVGLIAWAMGSFVLWRLHRKFLAILHVVAGGLLTVGGILAPELRLFLIAGIPLLALAVWGFRKPREAGLQKLAHDLLKRQNEIPELEMVFNKKGMILPDGTLFPYKRMEAVYLTDDLLAPVYEDRVVFLRRPRTIRTIPGNLIKHV